MGSPNAPILVHDATFAQRLKKWAQTSILRKGYWYGLIPLLVACLYWGGLSIVDIADNGWLRIGALPKTIFDQTYYQHFLAVDAFEGWKLLPKHVFGLVLLTRYGLSWLSLSEIYVIGLIASVWVSLWATAWMLEGFDVSKKRARASALLIFSLVQIFLILRPGAPSWFWPGLVLGFGSTWRGWRAWQDMRWKKGLSWWLMAALAGAIYPWYFAFTITWQGMLALYALVNPKRWYALLVSVIVLMTAALFFRETVVSMVSTSSIFQQGVAAGMGWSHTTALSSTLLAIGAWFLFWVGVAYEQRASLRRSPVLGILLAWLSIGILWLQPIATGASIIPSHFIYVVWFLASLSLVYVLAYPPKLLRHPWVRIGVGIVAGYLVSILYRLVVGVYTVSVFTSLLIHIGIWLSIICAGISTFRRSRYVIVFCVTGIFLLGSVSMYQGIEVSAAPIKELRSVQVWLAQRPIKSGEKWCSDYRSADFLFATTGHYMQPTSVNRTKRVSLPQIWQDIIGVAELYHSSASGDLYIWDDVILGDHDFICRVYTPFLRAYQALPISQAKKNFLSGCDIAWVEASREGVKRAMEKAWTKPIPAASFACQGLIVRRGQEQYWKVPTSHTIVYEDDKVVVWHE